MTAPQLPFAVSRRRVIAGSACALLALVGLYVLLPRLAGLEETWRRIRHGDPWWLAAAMALEVASYASYVMVFSAVFSRAGPRIDARASYEITMAGVAATRLLGAGGAGGIALTAWAVRRAGVPARQAATTVATFLVLLYAVFMSGLVVGGVGLRLGLLAGPAPFALTVLPAALAGVVIALALAFTLVPADLDRRVGDHVPNAGRAGRWLAAVPATLGAGVRGALRLLRGRDPRVAGAVGWWAFDIAVLWACLAAFGQPPAIGVIVMAYLVGTLGNLIPLPGGIGGVEAGMIGALIGFGVAGGLAIVAVLAYRLFSFWLPLVPGAVAYVQLVRTVRHWQHADGVVR